MCVIVKGVEEKQPVKFKNEKVMYLAELAVLKKFRRKGLGKSLILYGIMQSKLLNYEKMYMRTLEKGSMSYGIAKRIGFEEMENTYQYVERARTNGKIEKLKNIFLEFDLKKLNKDFLKKEIKSITNKEKGDEYERI